MDRDAPPTVRSLPGRSEPPKEMIRIEGAPKSAPQAKTETGDTERYWLDFYRSHDDRTKFQSASEGLREKIGRLNAHKKFRDVRAILIGYLTYHPKEAEPWMYEALALSIKMNKGSDDDVKKALGYAADLAVRSRNPNHLVSVADQLMLLGYLDRVGPLLDQAADLVPHRAEPLIMSINLAQKTKDPKRMGDSVAKLLSLGWPGYDEAIRRDARKQVETLAKALREDGRGDDADALLARLPDAEARDLFIRLSWLGEADLDLIIDEPLGATAKLGAPRTVFGGSLVKNGYGKHPEEVYVCPQGFDGEYTIRVDTVANDLKNPALKATLEVITHEGTPEEHKETHTIVIPSNGKAPEPVKVMLSGGRRKRVLPFLAPTIVNTPAPSESPERAKAKGTSSTTPRTDPKAGTASGKGAAGATKR